MPSGCSPPSPGDETDAETWARITRLVGEALDRPPADRAAFLGTVEPPGLAAEVEALVAAHEAAESTDAFASPFEAPPQPEAGGRLGPYRLIGPLGAGGMGAVYRAVRDDGAFEREVALKVVRHASPALARRFAREQRALARLEHPHIARLYDAGVAEDGGLGGTPFLAMELVEGEPITDYADRHRLGVETRVRLMLQVCEAVAYAHGRLVLHRDLKPSNVLVAEAPTASGSTATVGGPRAVVLDFGIAKLLGDDTDDLTQAGAVLTPAYAAPEQVAGREVTTAADVYGLGALLYEVLAGRQPHEVDGLGPAALEAAKAEPPPTPSAVAPPERARALAGDLDTICLKALDPEVDRRYDSAQALADDLRRHLDGLPVQARPPTVRYRVGRFVRRNRAAATAAAGGVALLALVVGVYTARLQAERDRAEARFEVAHEAARALLYDVHDAVAGLPGSTPAREAIVARSLDYLDRLADEAADDPALRIDLAGAYLRIGNVQGSPIDNNLGRPRDARASYRRGLALLDGLPAVLPDSLAAAAASAEGRLWEKLGVLTAYSVGPDAALPSLDRALAAQRRAFRLEPGAPERLTNLATAHINRADYGGHPYFPNAGRPDSALAHYARARALLESIPEADRSLFALRMLGVTFEREGTLHRRAGDLEAALGPTREALQLRERIAARPDADTEARRDVGVSREALAHLLAEAGRLEEAYAGFVEAQAVYDAILAADPRSVNAEQTVAVGHLNLARFLAGPGLALGRGAEARRLAANADRRLADLTGRVPDDDRLRAFAEEARTLATSR